LNYDREERRWSRYDNAAMKSTPPRSFEFGAMFTTVGEQKKEKKPVVVLVVNVMNTSKRQK
jgi:hypothetical protein